MKPLAAVTMCVALLAAGTAHSQDAGLSARNIRMLIGVGVGGDYDVQARFLARHLGRHLPGNPAVVAENKLGAGGLKMANYL